MVILCAGERAMARRFHLVAATALIALWGCSAPGCSDLPEAYRALEVPQERLASAAAQERGRTNWPRPNIESASRRRTGPRSL